jgi:lysozyme
VPTQSGEPSHGGLDDVSDAFGFPAGVRIASNTVSTPGGVLSAGAAARQLTPEQRVRNVAAARDAMSNPEVFALMQAISAGEGDYQTLNGGAQFNGWQYPRCANRAAGAYQIVPGTYDQLSEQLGLMDFSVDTQDIMAAHLIAQARAVEPLLRGDLPGAIARLRGTWPSLPGGSQQNAIPSVFQARYDANLRRLLGQ